MNIKLDDFKDIDINNAGNLPVPVKLVLLAGLFLMVLVLGYWFVWNPSLTELDEAKLKEEELRRVFVEKKTQAVNLEAYKQQMMEIEKTFGALLRQLPDRSQMDGLLTDINQAGLARGLEFDLFKPGQEVMSEFYAEMPIQIKVVGSYHDLGGFAADVSKLSRIVTLNDVSITKEVPPQGAGQDPNKPPKDTGRMYMDAVAKTYRYLDSSEVAARKKAEKEKIKQ